MIVFNTTGAIVQEKSGCFDTMRIRDTASAAGFGSPYPPENLRNAQWKCGTSPFILVPHSTLDHPRDLQIVHPSAVSD